MNAVIVFAQSLPEWWPKICRPRIQEWAQRMGAEFVEINPAGSFDGVVTRGHAIGEAVGQFSRSVVLDADVVVSRECPNIFDLHPDGEVYMALDAMPGDLDCDLRIDQIVSLQAILGSCGWSTGYGNAGVVLNDCDHEPIWKGWTKLHRGMWPDQGNLNWRIHSQDCELRMLSRNWNSFGLNNGFDVGVPIDIRKVCKNAYIAHAAGIDHRHEALRQMNELMP